MSKRNREHIFVPSSPQHEPYTPSSSGRNKTSRAAISNRRAHGTKLLEEYTEASAPPQEKSTRKGTHISFLSFAGFELALQSLDVQRQGEQPELVSVTTRETPDGNVQIATVYIPDGKKQYFLERLEDYIKTCEQEKAKHENLIEGIQEIRRATIKELWTDPVGLFPTDVTEVRWWEVWLRKRDDHELARFTAYASEHELRVSDHFLGFSGRTVILVKASAEKLAETMSSLDDIAELRHPHDVSSVLVESSASEQTEWVEDLRKRLSEAPDDAPAVCILDTGVQNSHPLLSGSLHGSDIHVADARWKPAPVHPHGTEMAGLALYGNLESAVLSSRPVRLYHRLESVKFLPDVGHNAPAIYGAITASSVARPEVQAPMRSRVFMLAVTASDPGEDTETSTNGSSTKAGQPTSWSATIDALSFGRSVVNVDSRITYLDPSEEPHPRLFLISAGNILGIDARDNHLDRSDLEPVEDPAQAWNALTVGAYSERDDMSGAPHLFAGYTPIASRGELSPVSRTSVMFDPKKWPFKPDVVADGGNYAAFPGNASADTPESLSLLTTRLQKLGQGFFTTTRDTSAATAQVSALAADIYATYPTLRPETVRALVVHSAQWTNTMRSHFTAAKNKSERVSLLRRYGMGVPDAERALRSASDALTLIAEATIRPFERRDDSNDGKLREMNLHRLPWPEEELENLGDTPVELRVTLSYFVEPNPSRRGWTGRYVYPSHGLRFATRRPEESVDSFRHRINKHARPEGKRPPTLNTETGWLFGSNQQQSPGSLHTDIWKGTAAELAQKGVIAVYPVSGWWKNRGNNDQSDKGVNYSLVVSIEAPEVDIDLWTAVAQQVRTPVEVSN